MPSLSYFEKALFADISPLDSRSAHS
jgi:hypothetical protein